MSGQRNFLMEIIKWTNNKTANRIGAEGAKMISEALKANSTLSELNLGCEKSHKKKKVPVEVTFLNVNSQPY